MHPIFSIPLILFMALFIGIGGLILYMFYRPLKKYLLRTGKLSKQSSIHINKAYIGLLILFAIFKIWTAFYPLNEFYRDEFESNTELDFPDSGKILTKDSNYPDFQGGYWSAAVVELNELDYNQLLIDLKEKNDFLIDTSKYGIGITKEFNELTKPIHKKGFLVTYKNKSKEWFKIAFIKDGKTIIFESNST
jgi:hypothetical protein